jgi:hypothetical protein
VLAKVKGMFCLEANPPKFYCIGCETGEEEEVGCSLGFTIAGTGRTFGGRLVLTVRLRAGTARDPFMPGIWFIEWDAWSGGGSSKYPSLDEQCKTNAPIPEYGGYTLQSWAGPGDVITWSRRGIIKPMPICCRGGGKPEGNTRDGIMFHRAHNPDRPGSAGCIVVRTDRDIKKLECCTSAKARKRPGFCAEFARQDWGICGPHPPPGMGCTTPIPLTVTYPDEPDPVVTAGSCAG